MRARVYVSIHADAGRLLDGAGEGLPFIVVVLAHVDEDTVGTLTFGKHSVGLRLVQVWPRRPKSWTLSSAASRQLYEPVTRPSEKRQHKVVQNLRECLKREASPTIGALYMQLSAYPPAFEISMIYIAIQLPIPDCA